VPAGRLAEGREAASACCIAHCTSASVVSRAAVESGVPATATRYVPGARPKTRYMPRSSVCAEPFPDETGAHVGSPFTGRFSST
jgi:hypothetical protein